MNECSELVLKRADLSLDIHVLSAKDPRASRQPWGNMWIAGFRTEVDNSLGERVEGILTGNWSDVKFREAAQKGVCTEFDCIRLHSSCLQRGSQGSYCKG